MTALVTPVATWDVREDRWRDKQEQRADWLKAAGMTGLSIYRIEFFGRPGDAPMGRIFCYHTDEQGKRHWTENHVPGPHDHDQCDVARVAPQIVRLYGLPPEELW